MTNTSSTPPAKPTGSQQQAGGSYEVARPHGQCAVTGRQIQPDEKMMAALRETPTGFERLDISIDAWPTFDKTGVLAFWQTTMPHPQAKKKLFVDDQVLCELFERLGDATEPAKLNFRFVLGLILMRKRLLVYERSDVRDDDREFWIVRFKGQEHRMDLLNPRLDEQQVTEVSQQLNEILNEEL